MAERLPYANAACNLSAASEFCIDRDQRFKAWFVQQSALVPGREKKAFATLLNWWMQTEVLSKEDWYVEKSASGYTLHRLTGPAAVATPDAAALAASIRKAADAARREEEEKEEKEADDEDDSSDGEEFPQDIERGDPLGLGFDEKWKAERKEVPAGSAAEKQHQPPRQLTEEEIEASQAAFLALPMVERFQRLSAMSDAEHQVSVPFRDKAKRTHTAAVFDYKDSEIRCGVPFCPPIVVRADGLDAVIGRLPGDMQDVLRAMVPKMEDINEIRLIAGFSAMAIVGQGEKAREVLFSEKLSAEDLAAVAGDLKFDDLERAALPFQLHRFSRWQGPGAGNEGVYYGLVMRLGKTVTGLAYAFADILKCKKSVLILAPPGYGKTTLLRDIIRVVSMFHRNVTSMIVDRSDEIGGASNMPHPSLPGRILRARLHGKNPGTALMQAFRNGTTGIVFCDEMATKEEAEALVFASQSGTRVIATAHGDLGKFVMSKPLSALSGSVQASTIGDEAADQVHGNSKVRLDRSADPIFDVLIEMTSSTSWNVFTRMSNAIDNTIHKEPLAFERRWIAEDGVLMSQKMVRHFH
ncbi:Uncharacterized protein HDU87_002649 [Geranomyces variabilis]|uniref:AAA+ ATPase domain-containing protein n=1 Tax=Geranomyces variabilis TaxID=109894 RepID=A0AAD5TW88_9FUNG|nr:Uncharacterized protein HDU87_002649 [Geranomyces variabilis]